MGGLILGKARMEKEISGVGPTGAEISHGMSHGQSGGVT